MLIYYLIVFFVFGTIFGSFFNVVGFRLPRGESIINPPSHCSKCNTQLTPKELIPIVSFILQKGKCRHCQIKIPYFYVLFEFLTGFLFALSFYVFGFTSELILAIILSSMAIVLIISDYHFMILSDEVLIVSAILIIAYLLFFDSALVAVIAIINGLIAFFIMWGIKLFGDFLFKKESMGGGDIKLLFVFGLLLGVELAILSVVLAAFIALPISLLLMLNKHLNERIIPFGPFLCLASLIIFFSQISFTDFIEKISLF